jgi:hypothetical protein
MKGLFGCLGILLIVVCTLMMIGGMAFMPHLGIPLTSLAFIGLLIYRTSGNR